MAVSRKPICVDAAGAGCGEGLLWDAERACMWWVDIAKQAVHCFDPETGATSRFAMPYLISALAFDRDRRLLVATAKGLGRLNAAMDDIEILHNPEPDMPGNRLNDMAVGPDGRLWAGTMSEGAKGTTGALYYYGPNGAVQAKRGTTISNGLDWSPDDRLLYFVDSVPGTLEICQEGIWRILHRFDADTGRPDGLCVAQDGTIWIAICDKGRVIGMTPGGEITQQIDLPCQIVTNCAFGGADLKTLYITTGTFSMTEDQIAVNPQAGGLFAVQMDVPGYPPYEALWPAG